MRYSAAILAGGSSSRMGVDKALVDFRGEALVERIAGRLDEVSDDVFVVAKHTLPIRHRVVCDDDERDSPLIGVLAALSAARHDTVFICACDMPFVSPSLVPSELGSYDAVMPERDGKLEALHGYWHKRSAEKVRSLIDGGERGLRPALRQLDVRVVRGVDPLAFTNLNTPEDLASCL